LECLACAVLLATVAGGCQTPATARSKPGAEIDPCAERLHDLCGHLLLYASLHGQLPERLADLKRVSTDPLPVPTCPVSGMPYVYNPEGLAVPGRPGRLVLYDAAPSHCGMRWGILADAAAEGQPLTARVILLPERPVFSGTKP
jgi:hypothetical protein